MEHRVVLLALMTYFVAQTNEGVGFVIFFTVVSLNEIGRTVPLCVSLRSDANGLFTCLVREMADAFGRSPSRLSFEEERGAFLVLPGTDAWTWDQCR